MKAIYNILNIIQYDAQGLIPAIIQDSNTKDVLMLGYMNEAALQHTLDTNQVTFFSRSKNRLWTKGETSGNFLNLIDIKYDCDGDALLISVTPNGPTCHTLKQSCFDLTLDTLYLTLKDRQVNPVEGSYTNYLFNEGINKILKKVGEETAEVIIAAKDNDDTLIYETSDLLYHLMVLLVERNVTLDQISTELNRRR